MSNATGPQSLSRLLADTPAFRRLICEARNRAAPTNGSTGLPADLPLPPALAEHTRIQLDGNRLLLSARNNSVAQMLRFHGPRLAKAAGVADFQVRVTPEQFGLGQTSKATRPKPGPTLSADAADILEQAASAIEHQPLADALQRLAALASEKN